MNILIINAFGKSPSAKAKYNAFCNNIREIFKRISRKTGIENFFYTLRDASDLDDFIYDADFNPNESTKSNMSGKKNFDKMDFIFVDGVEKYLPWLEEGYKLCLFLKLCKLSNKVLFAAGVAMQVLVFFLATGYKSEMNFINSKGELQSTEELHKIPPAFLNDLKKNDDFLDFVTGDIMEYNYAAKLWNPILNIGLHKALASEKYMSRGKFVLPSTFRPQSSSHPTSTEAIVSNVKELKLTLQKQYLSHWLLKNMSLTFVCYSSLTWFPHYFNVSYRKFQYKTLCESPRGPVVIEHENSVGVAFHPQTAYKESLLLLENFIREKFNTIQEMFYHIIAKKDNKPDENDVPNMFKYFKLNDEIRSGRNVDNEDLNNIFRPYSTIARVNISRPFSKVLKVNKEANHCGFGINNRDMVFVVNNSINQRPVSSIKITQAFTTQFKKNKAESNNDNTANVSNKSSYTMKMKLTPNENCRISQLFKIGSEQENKDKAIAIKSAPKLDRLKEEILQSEQNVEDYVTFIDKEAMEEDQMISYYKRVRRDICKKLQEIKQASEFRINKLDRLKFSPKFKQKTKTKQSLESNSKTDKRSATAPNERMKEQDSTQEERKQHENDSVFSLLFPYVNEQEFPKPIKRHIHDADMNEERQEKEIIKVDLLSKTGNNYNKKFKKYEKELKTMGDKPTMNCASYFITAEERERKEFLESKKKWMSNEDFNRVFGVKTTSVQTIPNIMSVGNSVFAHKFRDIHHEKWVCKKDFIL